jgi:hypothetical protein
MGKKNDAPMPNNVLIVVCDTNTLFYLRTSVSQGIGKIIIDNNVRHISIKFLLQLRSLHLHLVLIIGNSRPMYLLHLSVLLTGKSLLLIKTRSCVGK